MIKSDIELPKGIQMRVYNGIKPKGNFTQVDNSVIRLKEMHSGSKLLYIMLASLPHSKLISQAYLAKSLGVTIKTVARQTKDLKDRNLLAMKKIGAKDYECYIGTSKIPASIVMEWYNKEDKGGQITDAELLEMQSSYENS